MIKLNEGGNVVVTDINGNQIPAQRIPIKDIGRSKFIRDTKEMLKELNKLFNKKFKEPLWNNPSIFDSAVLFNGSTSFIMDSNIPDEKVLPHKPDAGDIDLIVPEDKKEQLWELLNELRGKKITDKFEFINHNKEDIKKIIDQINGLFKYSPEKGKDYFVQIDFELSPFVNVDIRTGKVVSGDDKNTVVIPSEWSRFGHSSSLEDTQLGIKGGIAHKYMLRSIAYAVSKRPDVIFVTSKADCDNWEKKIKKQQDQNIVKFSVARGLRSAYKPLICMGKQVEKNGKFVFKEIPTKESNYITELPAIFTMLFGKEPTPQELKDLWSFKGLVDLIKRYLDDKQVELAIRRMFELFWENKGGKNIAQEIDRDDPAEDEKVKMGIINYLENVFPSISKKVYKDWESKINDYYNNYGKGKDLFKRAVQNIQ